MERPPTSQQQQRFASLDNSLPQAMDNLRSLSGSLPHPSSARRHRSSNQQSQQQVIQAFKAAARSVTELYRTATTDISSSYSDGYQDALEDLLNFMDKENLGVGDGEGWRVRGWLAEKMDGTRQQGSMDGSEDEDGEQEAEEEKRARSSSPVLQQKTSSAEQSATVPAVEAVRAASPLRSGSAPPVQYHQQQQNPAPQFTFQAAHPYPSTQSQDMDVDGANNNNSTQNQQQARMRVNFTGRSSRNSHASRMNQMNGGRVQVRDLGSTTGTKRKLPIGDFFDISGFEGFNAGRRDSNGGSGMGGSKRNRLI